MFIRRIEITNFKSFQHLEVSFGDFNILIGANASGKTNLIQIFRFLRDLFQYDVENAVALQGGTEFFRNINLGKDVDFELQVEFDSRTIQKQSIRRSDSFFFSGATYCAGLQFKKRGAGIKRFWEEMRVQVSQRIPDSTKVLGIVVFRKEGDSFTVDKGFIDDKVLDQLLFVSSWKNVKLPGIRLSHLLDISIPVSRSIGNIGLYDIDPKLPKKAVSISGKLELEEDGSNLALVLYRVLDSGDESKRRFIRLLHDLLPFVSDISVERMLDKSLLLKMKEQYFKKEFLPASLLSDGTINIVALICALFFQKSPLTIFEEIERNIHPSLASRVLDMLREASGTTQIIATTHSPEMVRNIHPSELLLVSRDRDGFSQITRVSANEALKAFLSNDLGLDDLYVQNLLSTM